MRFSKIIIMTLFSILLLSLTAQASFTHPLCFYGWPFEITKDGFPGIGFIVNFGGLDPSPCYICPACEQPPLYLVVRVSWQNPNDPGGDPECWIPTFFGYAFYDRYWCGGRILQGTGSIRILNPTGWGSPDFCCFGPVRCSGSSWKIETWPVVSGIYKIQLYTFRFSDWPDYDRCPWCPDCSKFLWCGWESTQLVLVGERYIKVNNPANDFTALSDLFYVSADDRDTLYDGATMEVMKEYDIVCRIHTTKRIEDIPAHLIGYLEPEGVVPPTMKIFYRDQAGDIPIPCNQNYPLRIYGYRCRDGFMPYELFSHIDPPEWAYVTRYLDCKLYGDDNQAYNDIEMRTTVMAYLQLDCTNDSTVCFRPTAEERMEFVFRYGPEMGLNPEMDIRFRITDKDQHLVYEQTLLVPYLEQPFEDPFGLPPFSIADTMTLFWDGRVNVGPNYGHLADPALDSYSAIVQILDEYGNPDMETNIEIFDVVPTIDSVLVTHYPWYPPPDGGYIYIYSIIKGKVDDSDDPQTDYRYYIPNEEVLPGVVRFWDGESYMLHDLLPNMSPEYFYEDLNTAINVNWWLDEYWGDLSYKWYHVKDYAYKVDEAQGVSYPEKDTTAWWGPDWKTTIINNVDYKPYRGHPYMRLLVRSEVLNKKDEYTLNSGTSPDSVNAHKIMMSRHWFIFIYDDIIFWAISQIGVPYYYGGKDPYVKMDCSGFVTAAKIQELGLEANEYLRLNYINVNAYINGEYTYQGDPVSTGTFHILPGEAFRGDLVALKPIADTATEYTHICIVDWINADRESNYIYHSYIFHARGRTQPDFRRVRFDNLLGEYPPFINGYNVYSGGYLYQFIRFTPTE